MLDSAWATAISRLNGIYESAVTFERGIDPEKPKAYLKEFVHNGQIIGTYSVLEEFIRDHVNEIFGTLVKIEGHLNAEYRKAILSQYHQSVYEYASKFGMYEKIVGATLNKILGVIVESFSTESIKNLEIGLWSGPIGNATTKKLLKIYNYLQVDLAALHKQLNPVEEGIVPDIHSKFRAIDQIVDRRNTIAHTIEVGILDAESIFQEYQLPLQSALTYLRDLVDVWLVQMEFDQNRITAVKPIDVHNNSIICLRPQSVFGLDSSVYAVSNGKIVQSCGRIDSMEIQKGSVNQSVIDSEIGLKVSFKAKKNYSYIVRPNMIAPFA